MWKNTVSPRREHTSSVCGDVLMSLCVCTSPGPAFGSTALEGAVHPHVVSPRTGGPQGADAAVLCRVTLAAQGHITAGDMVF